jgi:hypothetical protein
LPARDSTNMPIVILDLDDSIRSQYMSHMLSLHRSLLRKGVGVCAGISLSLIGCSYIERTNNYVGLDSRLGERHIFRRPLLRHDSLLAVARRELVSDDGRSWYAQFDRQLLTRLCTVFRS